MRPLKFRGWHEPQKKMYSAEEMAADQLTLLPTGEFINVHGLSTKLSTIFPRDKFIPLQFIGLSDKHGKPIYEGDICLIGDDGFAKPMQIIYEDGCFGVKWKENHFAELKYYVAYPSCVVIGNIYENPELLKDAP